MPASDVPTNPRTPTEIRKAFFELGKLAAGTESEFEALEAIAVTSELAFGTDDVLLASDGTLRGAKATSIDKDNVVTAAIAFGTTETLVQADGIVKALKATSIATADVVTAASNFTLGELVSAAGNDKTTVSSGVAAANIVTASATFDTDNVLLRADGAGRGAQNSSASISDLGLLAFANTDPTLTNSVLTITDGTLSIFELRPYDGITGKNLGIGRDALMSVTTGSNNVGIGDNAAELLTEATGVVCIGANAGTALTTGGQNFCLGANSGATITTGSGNVLIGNNAGSAAGTTASDNIGIGTSAMAAVTGTGNTSVGVGAGDVITSGNNNAFVGRNAGGVAAQLATASNSIGIGNNVATTASNQVVIGSTSNTQCLLRGTVDVVRSTNACRVNIYNTAAADPPGTSYELLAARWDSNIARIETEKGSSGGTARDLVLGTDSVERLRLGASGRITCGTIFSLGASTELTIASGVVTVTKSHHTIDTQSDDATDDLDTINGGVEGDILVLRAASGARTVVVKTGTGNILAITDRSLDNSGDTIMLLFNGTNWVELSFADNGI